MKSVLVNTLILLVAGVMFGQNPPPARVIGTVESLNGRTLVVKSRDGQSVSVSLPADVRIVANAKSSLADIKQGDFVGSAAVKGSDGKLHAQEVHIFPEDMRGTGEGHRPMGPNPDRTMTNGNVTEVRSMTNGTVSGVSGSGNKVLAITYKDGEQEIEVEPSTPVITIVPGDESLLKPGAAVSIFAVKTDAGVTARIVTAEKDGVKPMQ